jgi:Holliday junction resolvasome RuvABC ATP-dependent DNA helicase subunit
MLNPHFKNIVGQEIAVTRLSESIESASKGGTALSPLVMAPAGAGKSHIMRAYGDGLEEIGFNVLRFKTPQEFRQKDGNFTAIRDLILGGGKWALLVDEAHEFMGGVGAMGPTNQTKLIWAFVRKALEKQDGRPISFDGENAVVFDRKENVVCLATNFPHMLDKSGAFQSRCDSVHLELYSREELVKILHIMLKEAGFKPANDNTLMMIANCGRGTARPMERIVEQLKVSLAAAGGKETINRDDVIHALRLSKMLPMGVQPWEANLMVRCLKAPVRDNIIRAILPQIEVAEFRNSKGYLLGAGLMTQTTHGLQTSNNGQKYLAETKKLGFNV